MAIGVLAVIIGVVALLVPNGSQWYLPAGALVVTVVLAIVAMKTTMARRFNQVGTVTGVVLAVIALTRLS